MGKNILDKVYEAVGGDYLDRIQIEEAVEAEVEPLLESLQELGVSMSEYRKAESAVWSAVSIAEQEAFKSGMGFIICLLLECLS
ncbi:MAG: hypothetical protein NC489_39495 [Ruminococcus flavefaciens]|nr:hypothetical protein [Ruminococcus flavefaciens]